MQDKIHQGLRVHMDVRGSSALMHVVRALCSVKAGNICRDDKRKHVFSTFFNINRWKKVV